MGSSASSVRTVVISGASRGIGFALAEGFATSGSCVVWAGVRDPAGRNSKNAERLRALGVCVSELDVSRADSVDFIGKVLSEEGQIDVLINNAGTGIFGPLESASVDDLRVQFETNVFGPHRLVRAALPAMRAKGRGVIVQVSSGAGRYTLPGRGCYSGSKWALEGMAGTLRREVSPFGIDVLILEPGPVESEFQAGKRDTSDRRTLADYGPLEAQMLHELSLREADPHGEAKATEVYTELAAALALPSGERPFRIVVHPSADVLKPYNDHLERLERHILAERGYFDDANPLIAKSSNGAAGDLGELRQ